MRKYLMGISAAAIIALVAGCGNDDMPEMDSGDHNGQSTSASAEQGEHNNQDIAFAQGMIPHHQQAVDMATLAAERATDPTVKDLASRIESAQAPEIQQLTDMLNRWGAPTEPTETESSMPGGEHGGGHGGVSEPGMMTEGEMQQLEQATGADFDRLWVEMMIKHHQGAVTMAKTELDKGGNAEAKALAQQIVDAQEAEISEMQAMAPQ